jgi:hypothetical protein
MQQSTGFGDRRAACSRISVGEAVNWDLDAQGFGNSVKGRSCRNVGISATCAVVLTIPQDQGVFIATFALPVIITKSMPSVIHT